MKYLLFNLSAIEEIVGKSQFQSMEFPLGRILIECIQNKNTCDKIDNVCVKIIDGKGIIFSGERCDDNILVFDLAQSRLLEKEQNTDDLLLILQKVFRTAIRIWNKYPFTASERINGSKSIIFPFVFSDHRRIVIERSARVERLEKRGITWPLLIYKYGTEDAPRGEEIPDLSVLRDAGETYIAKKREIRASYNTSSTSQADDDNSTPLFCTTATENVYDGGFKYLSYKHQLARLTITQKSVVESDNIDRPIRIDGPAGTGKTASMILRAYRLLSNARAEHRPFKIAFFSHSESTNYQNEAAFMNFEEAEYYTSLKNQQSICFTSLFQYCIKTINAKIEEVIEYDANEAKQSQRIFIEEALNKVMAESYKTYKVLLSDEMRSLFTPDSMKRGILISMLQHEFGVQIKGRTNCSIDEYYKLSPIENALPATNAKDKEFVFQIFKEYQNMLQTSSVYDNDDITLETLSQLNAPFWRRERVTQGFDYLFIDEMHLFNINEQHVFHFLTRDVSQQHIPICFALDYGQAIGDRGNIEQDYIEIAFKDAEKCSYKTVFRSSQEITDFCAAISAAGALMFQTNYRDPYSIPTSGFSHKEESWCTPPTLKMFDNDELMIASLKSYVDKIKKETQCKNREIAIITFDESILYRSDELESIIGKKVRLLKDRFSFEDIIQDSTNDAVILSSPYNINGLEFAGVILVGVDDGRVPQAKDVEDVSEHYIKYIAFNQLYLSSSRAKYRLVLLGNKLHGVSPCLEYAIESSRIVVEG